MHDLIWPTGPIRWTKVSWPQEVRLLWKLFCSCSCVYPAPCLPEIVFLFRASFLWISNLFLSVIYRFHTFYTSHLRWNSNMRRCFYHTDLKMQYFTIFQDKLHSFNIQNRMKHAWAFSKTVQKISKITFTASRFSLLTSAKFSVNTKRVTLQHNEEFILFFFYYYLMVL